MFRTQRGSALVWVILVLMLLLAAGSVLYLTVFRDSGEKTGDSNAGNGTTSQPQESEDDTAGQGGAGTVSGQVQEQGPADPGSNVRGTTTVVSPPITSGEEAFAAVLQTPEPLDWYWAVDDPRYEVTDEGAAYLVHLFSVVPTEGGSPEHDVNFGWYRVDKQTGTVSKIAK